MENNKGKCACGNDTFWMYEDTAWKCDLQKDGELFCVLKNSELEICCQKCGASKDYGDFKTVVN